MGNSGKRKPREVKRNARKNLIQDPSSDQLKDAYEEARKLVVLHEDPTQKSGRSDHALLPGVNQLSGDLIQAVIALRIQGFKDVDIAKHLDTSQPNISRLESTHPEAFAKAEIHALTQYERKFKINLLGVRAALSEAGPRLVQVLIDIAENPTLKENVRKDAAIAGLNLMGVGYTRTSVGGKDSTLNPGAVNTFIQNNINKEQEYASITSDVVDAEIVEEPS